MKLDRTRYSEDIDNSFNVAIPISMDGSCNLSLLYEQRSRGYIKDMLGRRSRKFVIKHYESGKLNACVQQEHDTVHDHEWETDKMMCDTGTLFDFSCVLKLSFCMVPGWCSRFLYYFRNHW